ncbi:hypothetical protein HHI36_017820 [Cryptolaemus montrouzieri]|uniref:Uncharacterized protein n=1 Tax=Cryptolaemus montrouzieri TaxID=559131 RepID=A0ABD2NPM4_9CUCU
MSKTNKREHPHLQTVKKILNREERHKRPYAIPKSRSCDTILDLKRPSELLNLSEPTVAFTKLKQRYRKECCL